MSDSFAARETLHTVNLAVDEAPGGNVFLLYPEQIDAVVSVIKQFEKSNARAMVLRAEAEHYQRIVNRGPA